MSCCLAPQSFRNLSEICAALQLSVHILEAGGPALLTKFWQLLPEALVLPGCHVTPSMDGEAFLFWTPGSNPLAWSPSAGLPTAVGFQTSASL